MRSESYAEREVSREQTDAGNLPVCRSCGANGIHPFLDLGMSPLCESFVSADKLHEAEPFYPLVVYVCKRCFLVQMMEYVSPDDIFSDYAYLSSYSDSWVTHAKRYTDLIIDRLHLGPRSQVIELASNDGYLLRHMLARNVPSLGIEPARNIAAMANAKGIPTLAEFFGSDLADRLRADGRRADLIIGNNVLAQIPDLHDFIHGIATLLAPTGTITMEFPHLTRLIAEVQFDTIYHEHFSYFSLLATETILSRHGLRVYDVEELPSHGGSLRIFATHADAPFDALPRSPRVDALVARERSEGIERLETYDAFAERVREAKRRLLEVLIALKREGKSIVGYGAPGKGNTLLNYCGVGVDFIDYTVDRNPLKQGKYLPGSRIPIYDPNRILLTRPDYVLILPWNLRDEIVSQLDYIRAWGGRFIVPIPGAEVF